MEGFLLAMGSTLEQRPSLFEELETGHGGSSRQWLVSPSDILIVAPRLPDSQFDSFLAKKNIGSLTRPPEASELDNYAQIVVLEGGTEPADPLKTRAIWRAQNGAHALGALFPSQRAYLKDYETLTGVLFPSEISYQGNVSGEVIDPWLGALANTRTLCYTRVLSPAEQRQNLERLLEPRGGPVRLGIMGLGDIGGYVAQTLYAQDKDVTNIEELIIASRSPDTVETMRIELEDMDLPGREHPHVTPVTYDNLGELFRADVILFLASGYLPSADSESIQIDVRAIQHSANAQIIRELAEHANTSGWNGIFLVASDPVEQLAMTAFGEFSRKSGNNQRVAGFGSAINYSRARHQAAQMGIHPDRVEVYNVHGKAVVAVPYIEGVTRELAEQLSLRTGLRNYETRRRQRKPWRAPAEMITHALENMLNNRTTWASPFLPGPEQNDFGAFFGTELMMDLHEGTWTPTGERQLLADLRDVLERGQRWNWSTSSKPALLYTDPFEGGSDPKASKHIAFHEDAYKRWYESAERGAEVMNLPYVARADSAIKITADVQRAIIEDDQEAEMRAKEALSELIEGSLRRRSGILEEQIDLLTTGVLSGEALSDAQYSEIPGICGKILERVDPVRCANLMCEKLLDREEPETVIVDEVGLESHLPVEITVSPSGSNGPVTLSNLGDFTQCLEQITALEDFPLQALRDPHLLIRMYAWEKLNSLLRDGSPLSPSYAKKFLSLCHFGDDLSLYQRVTDQSETHNALERMYTAQMGVLETLSTQGESFQEKPVGHAVILGTTGAPLGQHHVDILRSALDALRVRYPEATAEGYVSIDDFSRSKAHQLLIGDIPPLVLRRRIAALQIVNHPNIHLLFPAIPIWFDTQNTHLAQQMAKGVPNGAKAWRLIGGDALVNYPRSCVYQQIPHIVNMRDYSRVEMDRSLNKLNFSEVLQMDDAIPTSSTSIREDLTRDGTSAHLNALAKAFMDHHGIFRG